MIGLGHCLLASAVAILVFGASGVALASLDPHVHDVTLPPWMHQSARMTQRYLIASPYGLFRRMTGVGKRRSGILAQNERREDGQDKMIITDASVSMLYVARPEIILEGSDDNGVTWHAYHFKYKPGDVIDHIMIER
jgi:hypothetical protein